MAADTPLGPEQAAARLRVRRAVFDWMVRLGWIRSPQSIEVRFGGGHQAASRGVLPSGRPPRAGVRIDAGPVLLR